MNVMAVDSATTTPSRVATSRCGDPEQRQQYRDQAERAARGGERWATIASDQRDGGQQRDDHEPPAPRPAGLITKLRNSSIVEHAAHADGVAGWCAGLSYPFR